MSRNRRWLRVGLSAWSLGMEASSVIALRMIKIGSGGKRANAEAERMISEKMIAGLDLQKMAMTGALGLTGRGATGKALRYYRRKVRANRHRLIKAR